MLISDEKQMTKRAIGAIETRNKIYNTAIELFLEYGFQKVTVVDIARLAGVSKGSFYTYFDSKESVLFEFFQRVDVHYKKTYETFSKDMSAEEQMLKIVMAMTDFCSHHYGVSLMKIIYTHQVITKNKNQKLLNENNRLLLEIICKIVRQGQLNNEFTNEIDEEYIVTIIFRSLRGLLYDWCLRDGDIDLNEEGQKYFKQVMKMIVK